MQSIWLWLRPLPGIYNMHSDLWKWQRSPPSHPLLWGLFSNTQLPHPFSLLLGQWHNITFLAALSINRWSMCNSLTLDGHCSHPPWPRRQMRQIIHNLPRISWLVFVLNQHLLPGPWRHYLRLVPSHHWHPFFVHTNGQTTLPQITSTIYPTPSWLINLGAIQLTRTFCVASKRRWWFHAPRCLIHSNTTQANSCHSSWCFG